MPLNHTKHNTNTHVPIYVDKPDPVFRLQLYWNNFSRTNPSDKRSTVEARHIHHITNEAAVKGFPQSPLSVVFFSSESVLWF